MRLGAPGIAQLLASTDCGQAQQSATSCHAMTKLHGPLIALRSPWPPRRALCPRAQPPTRGCGGSQANSANHQCTSGPSATTVQTDRVQELCEELAIRCLGHCSRSCRISLDKSLCLASPLRRWGHLLNGRRLCGRRLWLNALCVLAATTHRCKTRSASERL